MAAKVNLCIEQGATFQKTLTWKTGATADAATAVDLTGYTARMQVRSRIGSSVVLLELTTTNGGITLGGTAGTIALLATDEQTALLMVTRAHYDLELVSAGGVVRRLTYGTVTISPEVTK